MDLLNDIAVYAVTGLIGAVAWFLRSKDEAQAKQIALLFTKHDEDAERLASLEVRIAKEHYLKTELDQRFDRMENSFRAGFLDLGNKLDKLTTVLMEHVSRSNK